MKIDKEKCTGCDACQPYCPVSAIKTVSWEGNEVSEIDQDECVECGACYLRAGVCPTDAIYQPKLEWPRTLREQFSNPHVRHPLTSGQGRGTEEMKTNDVTGRYRPGISGIAVEMGRPGIGTTFRDIQTVAMAVAKLGVEFEPRNPVTAVMSDPKVGKFKDEVVGERVLSAILEFRIGNELLKEVLRTLKEVSTKIDTVFSLDLISRVAKDGSIPNASIAREAGFSIRPNTKTNVGLGRPLAKED
jgi:NAD-dependent dihydropyrimidine dehydrogenase PreA subunit